MIKFLKKALLEWMLLEVIPIVTLILLAILYIEYIPEHWGKLMLLSIAAVSYIFVKLFIRLDK